jgi:hypothetical protein
LQTARVGQQAAVPANPLDFWRLALSVKTERVLRISNDTRFVGEFCNQNLSFLEASLFVAGACPGRFRRAEKNRVVPPPHRDGTNPDPRVADKTSFGAIVILMAVNTPSSRQPLSPFTTHQIVDMPQKSLGATQCGCALTSVFGYSRDTV